MSVISTSASKIMVSIIIPIYNSELFLVRCLSSVAGQTYKDLEVLCVDNGSTDGSRKICAEFGEKNSRFKYFYLPINSVSAARNFGIEQATGEYISFLDSDDSIDSFFIEHMIDVVKENSSDIAVCDINYIDSVTGDLSVSRIRFDDVIRRLNVCRTFCWGKVYRKSLFDNMRFPNLNYFEDVAVIPAVVAYAKTVSYVKKPLVNYYRNRKNSLSENYDGNCLIEALQTLKQNLIKLGVFETYIDEFKKMFISQMRFLCRRFNNFIVEKSEFEKIKEYLLTIDTNLEKLWACKFYASGDNALISGTDKAVVFVEQIVSDIETADFIICYSDCTQTFEKPVIKIPKNDSSDDFVGLTYDIAENIIEYFIEKKEGTYCG
ncbi:glycosyltransferase family 2 protein [Anaerocolumna sp. MB42-C2]|uniref:glycosyltransferase family 2 protein n=1 Tax=Anaerocolumna sp. MB42-C2 TaxID=3070997 RepID=UPI0027E18A3A|nr:glycosyltransferase family 2 protein [Anaerocolumna sp. MB42-C2]WMJ90203.1 glycosyltransferase family 2 protein [Anaerocolumna sp. MB42-C2]